MANDYSRIKLRNPFKSTRILYEAKYKGPIDKFFTGERIVRILYWIIALTILYLIRK